MKKIISSVIAAAMALTCFGLGTLSADAVEKSSADKTVTKKQSEEAAYKEGEALVVFKSSGKLTRAKASETIGLEDSMQIESMWDFDVPAEMTEDNSLLKRMTGRVSGGSFNVVLVKSDKYSTKELIRRLKKDKNVKIAEPNYKIKALGTNDTYFGKQWNLENTGQNGGEKNNSVNAAVKWDSGITGSSENVVAVVDTGVDYTHEELQGNMWDNTYQPSLRGECGFDFVNGDTDPMDDNGHGSHCAGIIGAQGNNGIGISGINQDVSIMALKILDEDGSGYASEEVSAYHYINKAMTLGVNVVAINNSWGGGEESEIFEMLVDIVGQKGAVTVCAAGNSYMDNDEYGDYPSNIDSPYILSVAASNENNELAAFSNYGRSSVDLAAPGTDILSTVSYDCYNPSLYSEDKQEEVTEQFNDYEKDGSTWAVPTGDDITAAEITDEEWFGEGSGHSYKISFKDLEAGQLVSVRIPYELAEGYELDKTTQEISAAVKVNGPDVDLYEDGHMFLMFDSERDKAVDNIYNILFDNYVTGTYFSGQSNYWDHFELECGNYEKQPKTDRDLIMMIYPAAAGDFDIYIDDVGLSRMVTDTSCFGRYDYYNGTSMAAPHVTGAVALAAAENPDADSQDLIDAVLTHVKISENLKDKTATGGTLDFSSNEVLGPRFGSVTVQSAEGKIIIKGGGFNNDSTVRINGQEAECISKSDRELIIKDKDWINSVADIEITSNGKTALKKQVYLVKGKTSYTELDEYFEFPSDEGTLSSNGKVLYCADSMTDTIYMADPADGKYMEFEELFKVKAEKYFKKDSESKADYDLSFGKDLPYADGRLYNIVAYSEVGTGISDEDYSEWAQDYIIIDDEDEDYEFTTGAAYSSQYKLMAFDLATEKVINLGSLPADIAKTEEWTLTSYNGRIYVIGGYDYSSKTVSRKVKIYDPAKKKWYSGPSLPEGRAAGKAVQSGDKLIYTLGYSETQKGLSEEEQNCPVNLILQGNTWKKSTKTIKPYYNDVVTRNGNKYCKYDSSVGICASGLVYTGVPVNGLGDTYLYNPVSDKYTSTKYIFSEDLGWDEFTGVMAGSTLYGFGTDDYTYKAVISSGLVKVSAPKYSKGTISGANSAKLPGTKIKLTAKPKKGYYVKSFYLDDKKLTGSSTTIRITKNQNAKAVFGKYVTKLKMNKTSLSLKAGQKAKLKVKVYPSNATNKQVTWKSSNTKYASVSSKGVVTAKRAGKGKTVTIKAVAKDGSKKYVKCKVEIK